MLQSAESLHCGGGGPALTPAGAPELQSFSTRAS